MNNEITVLKLIKHIEKKTMVSQYTSQIVKTSIISKDEILFKHSITPIKVLDKGIILFENFGNGQVLGFVYKSIEKFEIDLKKIRKIKSDDISQYTRSLEEYTNFYALDRYTLAKGVKELLK